MNRVYKLTVPVITCILILSSVMCCCIGKAAFASSSPMPSCHHAKKSPVSQYRVQLTQADTKGNCECSKGEMLAAVVDNNFELKSHSTAFANEPGKISLISFVQNYSIDLSAVGFSPQHFSAQKFSSVPLYLQNSVLRI